MRKKILIVFIIVLLLLLVIIQGFLNGSFADTIPAGFKLNQVETKVGEEVSIELALTNEKAFLSTDFVVNYDITKLEYVSYEKGTIENYTVFANESEKGTIKIAGIQDPAQLRTVSANTSIIVLKFNVIDGRGTQSNIELQCNSFYTTETEKSETVQSNGTVGIISTSGIAGNVVMGNENGDENIQAHAYLYKEIGNTLVDESIIDNNGEYKLEAAEPGEYYIKVKKSGYLDYNIRGIDVTEIDNTKKTINNIQLLQGDINDDGEIELLDLVKINDMNNNTQNLKKKAIKTNYGKKANNVNIEDIGYEE